MLRLLLDNNWALKSIYNIKDGYNDDEIANYLGLPNPEPHLNEKRLSIKQLRAAMQDKLDAFMEQQTPGSFLQRNIDLLGERVTLTKVQKQMLMYAVITENLSEWGDLFRYITVESEQKFMHLLACMLNVEMKEVKQNLSKKSFLRQSSLLSVEKRSYEDGKLDLMDSLEDALLADNESVADLLQHFLIPAKESSLSFVDYPHAMQDIGLIQDMLRSAQSRGDVGVNILLYGSPGTGKTELVRLMAQTLNSDLFEVKTEDDDGDAIKGPRRLGSYRLSQQLLAESNQSLILFDEIEDVFPVQEFSFFGAVQKSGLDKGWMNKTLEGNKTPAIWVCNQVQQIDAAFLRRFDFIMELNTPPKAVRLSIVRSYLQGKPVSDAFMRRLSEHHQLSPAQIAKVSKVANRMSDEENMDEVLEKVVENSLKAMSLQPLPRKTKHATHYDLDYLNTNIDAENLIQGLKRTKRGNLCFYGAPGTGKTAFAGYIADALGKPLLSKKASDILGMYVGESEKNIAAMFAEARREEAVLVLDEADSLLRDRRGANRSWEVSQVNELLVQMENFEGIFVCSTNLMDDLDQASLRRFALKVKFDYLTAHQACAMLEKECGETLSFEHKRSIQDLAHLAPGDYSAVKSRIDILGLQSTADVWIAELGDEVKVKSVGSALKIGF